MSDDDSNLRLEKTRRKLILLVGLRRFQEARGDCVVPEVRIQSEDSRRMSKPEPNNSEIDVEESDHPLTQFIERDDVTGKQEEFARREITKHEKAKGGKDSGESDALTHLRKAIEVAKQEGVGKETRILQSASEKIINHRKSEDLSFPWGSELREKREGAGMTQKELADKIGVARDAVSTWENKRRIPSKTNRSKIDSVLDGGATDKGKD